MTFICKQYRINPLTLATAGDYGYSGNGAQQANAEEDTKFEGYVTNVSAVQSTNQNVMQQLVARNNMQGGQVTQLQQQMLVAMNQPPDIPPNQYQQQ